MKTLNENKEAISQLENLKATYGENYINQLLLDGLSILEIEEKMKKYENSVHNADNYSTGGRLSCDKFASKVSDSVEKLHDRNSKEKPDVTEAFPYNGDTVETFEEAKVRNIRYFGDYPFDIERVKIVKKLGSGASFPDYYYNDIYYSGATNSELEIS